MSQIIRIILKQFIDSSDPKPVNPTKEQQYLACLMCKNLYDLCETGICIINTLKRNGSDLSQFPDTNQLDLYRKVLDGLFDHKMFIEDDKYGYIPDWDIVVKFNKESSHIAYKIYSGMKWNAVEGPSSKKLQHAIEKHDKGFFIENYDTIFEKIPFKQPLSKFKNMLDSKLITDDDQQYVWDFFEALFDMFLHEDENIEELTNLPKK